MVLVSYLTENNVEGVYQGEESRPLGFCRHFFNDLPFYWSGDGIESL